MLARQKMRYRIQREGRTTALEVIKQIDLFAGAVSTFMLFVDSHDENHGPRRRISPSCGPRHLLNCGFERATFLGEIGVLDL
jgi:hypothetical protein